MRSFKVFFRWYNSEDVIPTLKVMERTIAFYHDQDIDMLKPGCTLLNLADIFPHKCTHKKHYPFTGEDKNLLGKVNKLLCKPLLSFLHAKQFLTMLFFESLQTYANQL